MLWRHPLNIKNQLARIKSRKSSPTPLAEVYFRGSSPKRLVSSFADALSCAEAIEPARPLDAETFRYIYLTTCKNKRDWLEPLRRLYEDPSRRWGAK